MEQRSSNYLVPFGVWNISTGSDCTCQVDYFPSPEHQKVQETIVQKKVWLNDREPQLQREIQRQPNCNILLQTTDAESPDRGFH